MTLIREWTQVWIQDITSYKFLRDFILYLQKMVVDDLKLSAEDSPGIDVAGVRLDPLVVAHDLSCACSRHGSQQQGVPNSVLGHFGLEGRPVPKIRWCYIPHVVLEDTFADRRPLVGGVRPFFGGYFARRLHRSVIDGLEYLFVQKSRLLAVRETVDNITQGLLKSANFELM